MRVHSIHEKGLSVERIKFDSDFWEKELVPILAEFLTTA